MDINDIANALAELNGEAKTGLTFLTQEVAGSDGVIQVTVKDREEIPVFLSKTDDQILCVAYLWGKDEVKENLVADMHEAMLEVNLPMPLSSFTKIGDKYAIFGAMSPESSIEEIEHEIAVLSNNSLDVIANMSDYLV